MFSKYATLNDCCFFPLDAVSWPKKYEGINHSICTAHQVVLAVYMWPIAAVGLVVKDNKEMNSDKSILGGTLSWAVKSLSSS